VAATFDGETANIYFGGALENSLAVTGVLAGSTAPVVIGNGGAACRAGNSGNIEFDGLIDEVEVFNRALTADEIAAVVCAGSFGKCKAVCPTITLAPSTLPDGTVGVAYSQAITASAAAGTSNAFVTFSFDASDNCGLAFTNCSPVSGASFDLGTTTVTCAAIDTAGNSTNC